MENNIKTQLPTGKGQNWDKNSYHTSHFLNALLFSPPLLFCTFLFPLFVSYFALLLKLTKQDKKRTHTINFLSLSYLQKMLLTCQHLLRFPKCSIQYSVYLGVYQRNRRQIHIFFKDICARAQNAWLKKKPKNKEMGLCWIFLSLCFYCLCMGSVYSLFGRQG